MGLENYIQKLKPNKNKKDLIPLIISILNCEEVLVEKSENLELVKNELKNFLNTLFIVIKSNNVNIKSETKELDLDYWKDNIKDYRSQNPNMNKDVFFYSIRNTLKYLILEINNKIHLTAHLLEMVIKTFLFIDFLELSLDDILN